MHLLIIMLVTKPARFQYAKIPKSTNCSNARNFFYTVPIPFKIAQLSVCERWLSENIWRVHPLDAHAEITGNTCPLLSSTFPYESYILALFHTLVTFSTPCPFLSKLHHCLCADNRFPTIFSAFIHSTSRRHYR